ncbi:MAG TPA: hypothetical protein VJM34_08525 [Novosphingobium sp.]|nr:hypothetical protein [Novosphingobium sp.]
MDFDDQINRYFGTSDLATVSPETLASGVERMAVDFGLERDSARRFALWALMYMLGSAPELDIAFDNETDRDAARDLMDLLDRANE